MPCDYSKYPKNWKAIRAEVLERAAHQCEECGVLNKEVGQRGVNGKWYTEKQINGMNSDDGWSLFGHLPDPFRVVRIVLTISHTDHDVTNNGEPGNRPNLKALCQKCHLAHDHELHQANARATRNRKAGKQDLFA